MSIGGLRNGHRQRSAEGQERLSCYNPTDGSTPDQVIAKINCKATVVPAGGAAITKVEFQILLNGTVMQGAGGQATKQPGTNDWKLNSIVLGRNQTYVVKTIVTFNGTTKTAMSENITINP